MAAVRRASTDLLGQRSLHLRIVPRPANLSESREVYRLLKGFGDIVMFKHLRHEYHNPMDNIALTIYRDVEAAQKALDASPIRFSIEKPLTDHETQIEAKHTVEQNQGSSDTSVVTGLDDILAPAQLAHPFASDSPPPPTSSYLRKPSMPFEDSVAPPKPTMQRWFQVTVDRSRVVHQDYISRQPYWKQFTPMKSIAQQDLAKKVPFKGLSDVSKRPPHAHRTPNKVLKVMNDYVENRMPTLQRLWEEAERGERLGDGR